MQRDSNGNFAAGAVTVTSLSAGGATLSGGLTGTTAAFSGALSAGATTLSGALTGTSATLSSTLGVTGALTGTSATFSGALGAGATTLTGALVGTTATLSGQLTVTSENGIVATGTFGNGADAPTGLGTRMVWYPRRSAFRAGTLEGSGGGTGTEWNDANVGQYSVALGRNTRASGIHSFAMGSNSVATGDAAVAMGGSNSASGQGSIALGGQNSSTSLGSVALGIRDTASAEGAVALGRQSKATAVGATAIGTQSVASGVGSVAIGTQSVSSGPGSVAIGLGTTATLDGAVALGAVTTANAFASTALGSYASTNANQGAFVYGDFSTTTVLNAPASNSFTVRAAGGTTFYSSSNLSTGVSLAAGGGAWLVVSDRTKKQDFRSVDGEQVLSRIRAMSIQEWSYIAQGPSIRHVGPTAQDFYAAFNIGESNLTIGTSDISGINMLAIQALIERSERLKAENAALRAEISALEARVNALADLERRLSQLENAASRPR